MTHDPLSELRTAEDLADTGRSVITRVPGRGRAWPARSGWSSAESGAVVSLIVGPSTNGAVLVLWDLKTTTAPDLLVCRRFHEGLSYPSRAARLPDKRKPGPRGAGWYVKVSIAGRSAGVILDAGRGLAAVTTLRVAGSLLPDWEVDTASSPSQPVDATSGDRRLPPNSRAMRQPDRSDWG